MLGKSPHFSNSVVTRLLFSKPLISLAHITSRLWSRLTSHGLLSRVLQTARALEQRCSCQQSIRPAVAVSFRPCDPLLVDVAALAVCIGGRTRTANLE